jgi:[2Fe-2S] binding domain
MWPSSPAPSSAAVSACAVRVDGLSADGQHPRQNAWVQTQAPRCSCCQSGQIMQAAALSRRFQNPTNADIDALMNGNLCRCMASLRIAPGHQDCSGRSAGEGELKALPIKAATECRLIGLPSQPINIPAKPPGAARYGLDAQVAGMACARPKPPPTCNGRKVAAVDDRAALGVPGDLKRLTLDDPSGTVPGWVVVCADSVTAASQPRRRSGEGDVDEPRGGHVLARWRQLITDTTGVSRVVNDSGVDAAFAALTSKPERDYTAATVLHRQLEPLNALALQKDGRWDIHTGNQPAVAHFADPGQGAGSDDNPDTDAHLPDGRWLWPAPERLLGPGPAGEAGLGTGRRRSL